MQNNSNRILSYTQAINEAITMAMELDPNVICYGLGADDPKRIFGTTQNLKEHFGESRVFDMPTSENAMTGIGIGASLNGIRPIMIHQRMDFFLLAMDQLVNNAAKWYYMFGSQRSVPITIRLIVGQGWGQGPTHSQSLQAWFAHIPGLKVVMPTTPYDAKGLFLSSIFDNNPVIMLEHRWLHNTEGIVPEGDYRIPLGQARIIKTGSDLTIVSLSQMTIEALRALEKMDAESSCELIDLRSIAPIDWDTIFTSVKKTGRLLAIDTGVATCSVAGEIVSRVSSECFSYLKAAPQRLTLPDFPTPTSYSLTKNFYNRAEDIIYAIYKILDPEKATYLEPSSQVHHDVPGDWFKGPF